MNSEMNSLERVEAALNLETPDRVPVAGMGWTIGATGAGIPIPEYAKDGKKMAQGHLEFLKNTGVDILFPTSDVGQIAEGWGTQMRFSEKTTPLLDKFPVKEPADWEDIEVLDPLTDGRMNVTIEACDILTDETNNKVAVIPYVPSPLTSASHAREMSEVMMDMMSEPDLLHKGLEIITQTTIDYIDACMDAGAQGVLYATSRASGEIYTWDQYEEFGIKYDEDVLNGLSDQSGLNYHHVCGLEPFFKPLAELPNIKGINWWDKGAKLKLAQAKKQYGDITCLVAGLDQTETLMHDNQENVAKEAKESIEIAKEGGGFILSPGCEIAPETPLANMKTVVEIAEKYGKY